MAPEGLILLLHYRVGFNVLPMKNKKEQVHISLLRDHDFVITNDPSIIYSWDMPIYTCHADSFFGMLNCL